MYTKVVMNYNKLYQIKIGLTTYFCKFFHFFTKKEKNIPKVLKIINGFILMREFSKQLIIPFLAYSTVSMNKNTLL